VKFFKSQPQRVNTKARSIVANPHEVNKEIKWQESIWCKLKLKKLFLYLILSIGCRFIKRDTTWIANKVSKKLECLVLEFEFLSRFFVNPLLEVLQVIIIACFYL
jgi:hypothetical protein